jgi:hypothetical protein
VDHHTSRDSGGGGREWVALNARGGMWWRQCRPARLLQCCCRLQPAEGDVLRSSHHTRLARRRSSASGGAQHTRGEQAGVVCTYVLIALVECGGGAGCSTCLSRTQLSPPP